MAKLFNSIRRKLVSDKPSSVRTANYLKYAIKDIDFEGNIDDFLYQYTRYLNSLTEMQTLINKIVIETQNN